ncbi:MAG: V-type ATP synthase subunit C [Candidatus Heimdallarchaeota archaeon AB_125]|nr:MAG: V-type ATP synthase subunit C [Candidatus Heimdallarchaeota archaeon AB_125]
MSFGDISYILGRAHGVISNFLTKSQINLLLSSRNLTELRAAFTQTSYDDIIGDLNFETQISDVARNLKNSYSELLLKFYKQAGSSVKQKLRIYSERYNAENLRMVLQGIYRGSKQEEILSRLVPVADYSIDYYSKLLNMSIDEIISIQKNQILQRYLRKANEEFKTSGRFTPLESAIDQYVYSILPKVSKHYNKYVNMKNILALCRCIALGIPAYRYILPNKFIAKGLNSSSIQEVLEIYNYAPYRTVFAEYIGAKEVPLHELEFAVERYLLNYWKKTFRYGTVLQMDALIGFFEIKLAEIMDVIRIIVGISAGFSEEEIRENLLYYGSL